MSCYTLLSGFRLPWPPSCCLDQPTPFLGSDERRFGHLNPAFGSSRIASSAYQKWPTGSPAIRGPASTEQAGRLTHLKFENRLRSFRPQDSNKCGAPPFSPFSHICRGNARRPESRDSSTRGRGVHRLSTRLKNNEGAQTDVPPAQPTAPFAFKVLMIH